jgi:hypothetical protein
MKVLIILAFVVAVASAAARFPVSYTYILYYGPNHLGYDHVVLLLALIKLDYNLTSTSWHSKVKQLK